MTRQLHARLAGASLLLYIAVAFPSFVLATSATRGAGIADRLVTAGAHVAWIELSIVLTVLSAFLALVLAVSMHQITHDDGPAIATLAMVARVAEAVLVVSGVPALRTVAALAEPTSGIDPAATLVLGTLLLMPEQQLVLSAPFFALGSLGFAVLFWTSRSVPRWLSGLGIVASLLLVVSTPLQLAGVLSGTPALAAWLPMLLFEVPLGVYLLVRGVPLRIATR